MIEDSSYVRSGRTPIIPSARPPIHGRNSASERNMVRYPAEESDSEREIAGSDYSSNDEPGADEVDYPRSYKKSNTKRVIQQKRRRKSFNSSSNDIFESNERLAKSLPATFPSPLYSSGRWQPPEWQRETVSLSPILRPEVDLNYSSDVQNPNTTPHYESMQDKRGSKSFPVLFIITAVAIAVGIGCFQSLKAGPNPDYDGHKFTNELNTLRVKYSINEDSILLVQTGISTIVQNQDAGSFIFVYNSNIKNFDHKMFNNFINSIATAAARYLRKDTSSVQQVQHTVIESSKLLMQTHSELIQKYREDVSRTGLMLVKDIEKLPSTLAMAFHYYCDEYNPLVKRSAIFFTLDIANCSDPNYHLPNHAYIEKCLAKKWTTVPKDNIGPLLTRVVGTVVDTTSNV